MKPKLYQYAACPFCNKVRTILKYKRVDFETIEVHPLNKKEIAFSAGYRAVPIYVDSKGEQVNDSTPIMRHIDGEFPSPPVFKNDEEEKKWLDWSEKFVKGLPPALYDTLPNALKAFDYITKVGKFSLIQKWTIKYSGAIVMKMVAKKIAKRENIDDPKKYLMNKAAEWAEGLKGRPFMAGDNPGAADIAVFGISRSVAGLPAMRYLDQNGQFSAWLKRMEARIQITDTAAILEGKEDSLKAIRKLREEWE